MSKICHEHCPGGAGVPVGAAVVIIFTVAVITSRPAHQAASTAVRVITDALEIAGIVIGSALALAVVAALAVVVVRVRRAIASRARAREVELYSPVRVLSEQTANPPALETAQGFDAAPAAWPIPWLVTNDERVGQPCNGSARAVESGLKD
jgi:hypothetical protein